MYPIIEHPHRWAQQNDYTLSECATPKGFKVKHRSQSVGLLKEVAGGYRFINGDTSAEQKESPTVEASAQEFVSHSFGLADVLPFSLERATKDAAEITLSDKTSGTGHAERISDCNYWLPYAAEHYHVSRDIRDYVLVPIPAMFSDLPNTNGDSLSLQQMLRFDPSLGMQMYKTFKGKPTHLEHDNRDITKAKGIILDSFLRPVPFNPKYYKIVQLLAFDRTKDPLLVEQILNREHNAYSVGFYYSSYTCSICGTRVGKGINHRPCAHTQLGKPTYRQTDGQLVYRKCEQGVGFECSCVATPAYVSATGPRVFDPMGL